MDNRRIACTSDDRGSLRAVKLERQAAREALIELIRQPNSPLKRSKIFGLRTRLDELARTIDALQRTQR